MRFSVASVFLCAALVNAVALPAPVPAPKAGDVNKSIPKAKTSTLSGTKAGGKGGKVTPKKAPVAQDSQKLQKRIVPLVVLAPVAVSGAAIITKIAIEIASQTLASLQDWNKVRETFTSKTTDEMWARNSDYKKFPAVACYNKGYRLSDPKGIDGLYSAKLELGLLNTDYDCMYIAAPNQFFTDSAGGFINLSYTYDAARCTFDGSTGDLTCK